MRSQEWTATPRNLIPGGIHDDRAARSLGFAGGFVPGVVLYEHVVNELLDQGLDWLREGSAEFLRFRRPVYDGEAVRFRIDAGAKTFAVTSLDGSDERASGRLSLSERPPALALGPAGPLVRAPLGEPAQIGVPLELVLPTDPERVAAVRAAEPAFVRQEDGRTVCPISAWLNPIDLVRAHFDAPVTIHVAGRVWHHGAPYLGETIVKRGQITGFSERNGNRIVHFDVAVLTDDGRPLATLQHQSVFSLARSTKA